MSEYDAFGRKKDEAGLGDLGWGSTGDPDAVPNPDPVPDPVPNPVPDKPSAATAAAESGFSGPSEFRTAITSSSTPSTWRPRRNPAVWLIQLAVLGGIAFAIYSVVDAGRDTVNSVRDTFDVFDDLNGNGSGSGDRGDGKVPDQVAARKLFTPTGLRSAIKVMEKEVPGKIYTLSFRRDRLNASVIQGNKQVFVNFNADAEVPEIQSSSTAPGGGGSLSYEEINVQAPFKLLKAANQRVNRSDADVDYFVVQAFSDEVGWSVFYEGGTPYAQGDSRGRLLRVG